VSLHRLTAASTSARGTARSSSFAAATLSNRSVYSRTARSPRARTSARMAETAASTSSCAWRPAARKAAKAASKPGSRLSSLSAIGGLPNPFDPPADLVGGGLQRGPVDREPGRNIGDVLDLDQIVGAQRRTGGHEVHDAPAQAE